MVSEPVQNGDVVPGSANNPPPSPQPSHLLADDDAALLLAILEAPGSVAQAAAARTVAPGRFLAIIANPAARQALENLRVFAAIRRELRADADRDDFVAVLKDVARASTDLVQKRLAATTALRALSTPVPRSSPGFGGDGRAAGGLARRTHGAGRVSSRPDSSALRGVPGRRSAMAEQQSPLGVHDPGSSEAPVSAPEPGAPPGQDRYWYEHDSPLDMARAVLHALDAGSPEAATFPPGLIESARTLAPFFPEYAHPAITEPRPP